MAFVGDHLRVDHLVENVLKSKPALLEAPGSYDLMVHSRYTGASLAVKETPPEPVKVEEWQATLDKKLAGARLRKDAKAV
jgi:glycyl-tRNA synthetase